MTYFEENSERFFANNIAIVRKVLVSLIFFFDIIILPHVFQDTVLIESINIDDIKIEIMGAFNCQHPESVLAKQINQTTLEFQLLNNKYIGVSLLCCVQFLYLNSIGFEHRGRCKTFYENQRCPNFISCIGS